MGSRSEGRNGQTPAGAESTPERVERALAGDRGAFARLVEDHRALVLAVTRRSGIDPSQVDDVFHEAVVVALVSLPALRQPERFGSWLCGIARNIARRSTRSSPTAPLGDLDPADERQRPDEAALAAAAGRKVRIAIDALPPGQRAAARLYYLDDQPVAEIARRLEIGPSAVKSRLHDARRALTTSLATEGRASDDGHPPLADAAPTIIRHQPREAAVPTTDATTPTSADDWIEVSIDDLRASEADTATSGGRRTHVVVLADGGGRRLPIWIGEPEAAQLAIGLERHELPRPMTYALADALLGAVSARVVEIRITSLVERVFYGTVVVEGGDGRREVDARPSDALNLALVAEAPILVAAELLAQPAAVDGDDWEQYPLSAREVVDDVRRRMEEQMSRLAQEDG